MQNEELLLHEEIRRIELKLGDRCRKNSIGQIHMGWIWNTEPKKPIIDVLPNTDDTILA